MMDFKTIIAHEKQQPYYQELEHSQSKYATKTIYPPKTLHVHLYYYSILKVTENLKVCD